MKKKIIAILVNGELMFMSIVVLVPVVWIILSAFQSGNALGNLSLSHLTLNNFQRLFSETNYGTWFVNTLEIAVVSTCCSVILIMLTSWVMSRFPNSIALFNTPTPSATDNAPASGFTCGSATCFVITIYGPTILTLLMVSST